MISLSQANNYFQAHKLKDVWVNSPDDVKENILLLAENYLKTTFNLREGAEESTSYEFAVYEQAIHLLSFDKERLMLQSEGVMMYSFDGINTQMKQSFISPIAHMFLKKYIFRKVGDIR